MLYPVHLAMNGFELTTLVMPGTDCTCSCKFSCHTVTTTTTPSKNNDLHFIGSHSPQFHNIIISTIAIQISIFLLFTLRKEYIVHTKFDIYVFIPKKFELLTIKNINIIIECLYNSIYLIIILMVTDCSLSIFGTPYLLNIM